MTRLQMMAIGRIKELVQEIDLSMTAYAYKLGITQDEAMKLDRESAARWTNGNRAQQEAAAWLTALGSEHGPDAGKDGK